jgi:diguanylate cyclase (GGDEF)-like protein/PAS domain S-box-containing protein
MEQSRDTGLPTISAKHQMAFGHGAASGPGFILFVPVYRPEAPANTVASRRAALLGWVYAPISSRDMMAAVFKDFPGMVRIDVYDGRAMLPPALLYGGDDGAGAGVADNAGAVLAPSFATTRLLLVGGHEWSLQVQALPAFGGQVDTRKPLMIAWLGIGGSIVLAMLCSVLVGGRQRAMQAAAVLQRQLAERQQLNLALRRADSFNRATLDAMQSRVCVIDGGGTVLALNAAWHNAGRTACARWRCSVGGNYLEQSRAFFGDDEARADEIVHQIGRVMAGQLSHYSVEHSCCSGAALRWYACHVTRFADASEHIVVVHDDITERKAAEASLSLAAMVYRNSSEAMVVSDASGNIIDCNRAFSAITGYTADEVLGKNPRIWSSGRHDKAFFKEMWGSLAATGMWQGEIWNKRKNGEIYPEWLTLNAIQGEHGEPMRYVALFSDLTEKRRSEELIWTQVNYDALTGLPNRHMCQDRLMVEVAGAETLHSNFYLLIIDLDHFAEVNDTLGHFVGDGLLLEAARRIGQCVGDGDLVCRFGGDEFAVLLRLDADAQRVASVAAAITSALAESYLVGDETIYLSASTGISHYPGDALTVADLLKSAEQAMADAKQGGRNCFRHFSASMRERALTRQALASDLRGALDGGQFEVYYQPIVELATREVHKAEALLRWHHPQRGMVSPADFIPIAEELGLINDIGDWVFRQSATCAKQWGERSGFPFQISVNKSPVQFMAQSQGTDWVAYLDELGLPGEHITVEITEGLLLNAGSGVSELLDRYRAAGMCISIDDFGTGYSALSYLKKFHLDFLKIDQSFVRDMEHNPSDRAIVEAIIVMAHKLGFKVIAEGIETEGQRDLLLAAGCDLGQGYLFSRPVPARQFEALVKPAAPSAAREENPLCNRATMMQG